MITKYEWDFLFMSTLKKYLFVGRWVFLQSEPVDTLTVFSCMNSYRFILNMILTQFVSAFLFFTFFFELVYELIVKDFCFLVLVILFLVLQLWILSIGFNFIFYSIRFNSLQKKIKVLWEKHTECRGIWWYQLCCELPFRILRY